MNPTHGQLEAPNCLGPPKLAWLRGFLAIALCFCLCKAQNQVLSRGGLCKPAGPRVCPAGAAHRQPGAPGRLGRPKLAWLLGFGAFALRFCLCKAQNQVMAGAWPCKPAGPRVCPAGAAYRQPGAPGRLGRPKLAWLLGFWAIALRFCCAGPKTGLWPKLGSARQPGHVCSVQGLPIGG